MKKSIQNKNWLVSSLNSIKNGVHFGHKSLNLSKKRFWHPLMAEYILGIRNTVAIINIQLTKKALLQAFFVISLILKQGGHVLIINTNPEYYILTKNLSLLTLQNQSSLSPITSKIWKYSSQLKTENLSYCYYKWIGGTLTNWKQVSKSVLTYAKFSERCENFLINNNIDFPRYRKIKTCFQGLIKKNQNQSFLAFHEKPDLIFLLNPNENHNVILEANKLHIPVIALTESNTNLQGINYPIPVNNYSAYFIYFCLKKIIKLSYIFFSTNKKK